MCRQKLDHGGVASRAVEEESCDEAVIDRRGSCPLEGQATGFGGGASVVCMYSSSGRPCSACQSLSWACMVRALHSCYAL